MASISVDNGIATLNLEYIADATRMNNFVTDALKHKYPEGIVSIDGNGNEVYTAIDSLTPQQKADQIETLVRILVVELAMRQHIKAAVIQAEVDARTEIATRY